MTHPCGGLNLPARPGSSGCNIEPRRMDFRGYGIGAQILALLGLKQVRLLTNSSRKVIALDGYGLEIIEQLPVGRDE
jgi:3,4-dihydroxy 2-butanone 4-phosphate synthase/GTP cyclohydrolase II